MSQPKRAMGQSEATYRHAESRMTRTVVVVEGITVSEKRMIEPHEFDRLRIDSYYQRPVNSSMVNDLIHVLKNNGRIYDDVVLCVRDDEPDVWYLVDGQQRYWAHDACGVAFPAVIYRSTGRVAEAQLYQVLNTRKALTANNIVKGYQGEAAAILRRLASIEDTAYYNQIQFGDPGKRPYAAGILMRAMLAVATGILPTGPMHRLCARADHALATDPAARPRIDVFLKLLPLVFPATRTMSNLPPIALARVAFRKFQAGAPFPSPRVYEKLKRVSWDAAIEGKTNIKWLVVLEQEIERIWS